MKEKILALLSRMNNKTVMIICAFIVLCLAVIGYFCPDALMKLVEGLFE